MVDRLRRIAFGLRALGAGVALLGAALLVIFGPLLAAIAGQSSAPLLVWPLAVGALLIKG